MNIATVLVAGLVLAAPIAYLAYADTADAAASPIGVAGDDANEDSGSQTIQSVERMGVSVGVPGPSCPLQCTMGYGFTGESAADFEIPEGIRSVDVVAHWTAAAPTTRDLWVFLYQQDDACGEGCYMGVAGDHGVERVTFTLEDPEPGVYHVGATPTGRAYATIEQDVWFEVTLNE